jgi:hypothetical protein
MARRIVRTAFKALLLPSLIAAALYFLDSQSRVIRYLHGFLPEHHDGHIVTDITYLSCTRFTPVSSTAGLESRSSWAFTPAGCSEASVFYKRKLSTEFLPTSGETVVVDVKISRLRPDPGDGAGEPVAWEQRPGSLWIKRAPKLGTEAVTAVDVLFGPDAVEVREGWTLKEGSLSVGEQPRITVRRGQKVVPKRP